MKKQLDVGSILVVAATLLLFVIALLVKGFSHDLLLEAGVFLVSVKLIMMALKNSAYNEKIVKELHEIKQLLRKDEDR